MSRAVDQPQNAATPSRTGLLAMRVTGRTLRGRIGAIAAAGMAPLLNWCGVAGWQASIFVRDLLQRHQWLRMGDARPERVFVARNTLMAVHAPQQYWHLAYAPRVVLQLAASDRAVPTTTQPVASAPMRERIAPHEGPRFISMLIERVLNRNERIDALKIIGHAAPATLRHERSAPAAAESRIAAKPDREGRVQRVFRTANAAAAAKAMAGNVAVPSQSASPPTWQTAHAHESEPARNAPQINLEHLADRVVHAIDRRLIAHRERNGRA